MPTKSYSSGFLGYKNYLTTWNYFETNFREKKYKNRKIKKVLALVMIGLHHYVIDLSY